MSAGKQASLFGQAEVRAITLTRRQQIDVRLEQARESRDPDSFWALWFERERLRCQDAARTAQEPQGEAEEANEGLQSPEGQKARRKEGER